MSLLSASLVPLILFCHLRSRLSIFTFLLKLSGDLHVSRASQRPLDRGGAGKKRTILLSDMIWRENSTQCLDKTTGITIKSSYHTSLMYYNETHIH